MPLLSWSFSNGTANNRCYSHIFRAPEELKPYLDKIVPVVFLSRHDPVEEVAKIYKDAWEEFGLGNAGIRSNLDDVVNVIIESLGSSSWSHKKQAALSLKDIGDSTSLCTYMKPYLGIEE